ncbi:RIP homotypic interaction motif-containing protein [Amycolatopsis kentuckyensis]|uniref:RIP homotypic interaction motif-containing protein n=1 Tax=Amycolatopsis kentuckyensis TaxID=218823 RepID=UPI000A3A9E13|nr:RIP homotypic interaction motif-containing protein [Amycolatopsis kentuckyensis]
MAVEAVELVVSALTAGAVAGVKDSASAAVKDAYASVQSGVRRLLSRSGAGDGVSVLEAYAAAPDEHRDDLVAALTAAGVAEDAELVAAAQAVLAVVDPPGAGAGKYDVRVRDSQGVQVGDGNTMKLKF